MKRFTAMAAVAAIALTATGAVAQTVSQTDVLGQSGNTAYPLAVEASNGITYACKAEVVNGMRTCVRSGGSSLFGEGAGLGTGAAVGAAALVLLAVVANSDDDAVGTTTTAGSDS
jgi:hypothetical protein